MIKSSFGDRMKEYEGVSQGRLIRRCPVIIRLDGKAFHTFCRGFDKPFDDLMVASMLSTMRYLCDNIQGCIFGYTQSDEITLLLKDWQTFETSAWFDNKIQKMTSVSASMATLAFNKTFREIVDRLEHQKYNYSLPDISEDKIATYRRKVDTAMFDSRVFNLSKEEVCNNFIWRQQDAIRNSIQSLAQSMYSPKQLHGISTKDLQDKMLSEKGVNWSCLDTKLRRGACCIRVGDGNWIIDEEIPIFSENRDYIESLL